MRYLLNLLLVISPVPRDHQPLFTGGDWIIEWGDIKPYLAQFHADYSYDSDEPWGSGEWWLTEAGEICFEDRSGRWLIRITDWKAMSGEGRKILPDGTLKHDIVVRMKRSC